MKYTYRITILGMGLNNYECPPAIVSVIFPAFNGEPVELSQKECLVTFSTPQTPTDLGPLVKVELLQN
jgi:hypothetical protein